MKKIKFEKVCLYVFLILIAALWLLPILFMVFTAVKTPADLFQKNLFAIPKRIAWENFAKAWEVGRMGIYMKNSLIVSGLKVPLGILLEALAAFGLTRMNLKRSNKIFIFFLIGMTIPIQVTLIPLNIMLQKMHLINTYRGLFLVYLGFGLPMGILVLRGFFRTIPRELDEAALIDGCNYLKIFWCIILPIAKPAIATLVILDFLGTWNEFLLASVFITDDALKTIPTGIMAFRGQYTTDYTLMNAGVLISILPVFIIYIIFQRHFVSGLGGSIKG